jgi:sulfite exporter TauE/SafE
MQGFLLGLANGTTCLAFCAPVLVPYLLQQGAGVGHSLLTLLQFLAGRLGGYLLFGLLAWATGNLLAQATQYHALILAAADVGLAVLLLVGVLRRRGSAAACALEGAQEKLSRWPALLPLVMGLLAGLKVCPPLLLAFADAASAGSLAGSLLVFATFFLGTSIYFLPVSLVGAFRHAAELRIVARFAAILIAAYYLLLGVLLFMGGVS